MCTRLSTSAEVQASFQCRVSSYLLSAGPQCCRISLFSSLFPKEELRRREGSSPPNVAHLVGAEWEVSKSRLLSFPVTVGLVGVIPPKGRPRQTRVPVRSGNNPTVCCRWGQQRGGIHGRLATLEGIFTVCHPKGCSLLHSRFQVIATRPWSTLSNTLLFLPRSTPTAVPLPGPSSRGVEWAVWV